MSTCLNPLHRKYADAGHVTRLICKRLTEAPDGLIKHEIEEAADIPTAAPYIYKLSRWGLEFNNEWLISCCLENGRQERLRLYKLTPQSLKHLSQAITQVHAAGL